VPEAKPVVKPSSPPQPVARRPIPAAPAPPPPAPLPQLREIISGDQRRQYDTEFVQGVGRAGAVLREASAHTLNAAQRETVSRIRTFLDQAAAVRDTDISTALQLARRADLLGQELLKTLK
jgi:hypothetical protein